MNVELARFNMIEQQIRPWDVLDDRVLSLLTEVRREDFVPTQYQTLAFADIAIPLDHDQTMMAPKLEARMLQALGIRETDKVLEIGTGSGYVTALLAKLAQHVFSVDIHADFSASAKAKLEKLGLRNITLETGDSARGWSKHAPYDVIAVSGSCPVLPEELQRSLKLNGRLFVVCGQAPIMEALLITRTAENAWASESLFETDVPALANLPAPRPFVF